MLLLCLVNISLLPSIINKGINVFDLLNRDIFTVTYDYDEWPGNHVNDAECLRGYAESFFHLRHHYKTVFQEDEFRQPEAGDAIDDETARVFKVKYSINLLNQVDFYYEIRFNHFGKKLTNTILYI